MPEHVATRESRVLNEPSRRDFVALLQSRIAWDCQTFLPRTMFEVYALLVRYERILKERTCAAAVGIAFHNQHPLARANLAHRLAGLNKARGCLPALEMALQVCVFDEGCSTSDKPIDNTQNDEPSALGRIEDA
jgi:hypothetical protein